MQSSNPVFIFKFQNFETIEKRILQPRAGAIPEPEPDPRHKFISALSASTQPLNSAIHLKIAVLWMGIQQSRKKEKKSGSRSGSDKKPTQS